jgi:hypothetical protein
VAEDIGDRHVSRSLGRRGRCPCADYLIVPPLRQGQAIESPLFEHYFKLIGARFYCRIFVPVTTIRAVAAVTGKLDPIPR